MRKLYTLLAGLLIGLAAMKTYGQMLNSPLTAISEPVFKSNPVPITAEANSESADHFSERENDSTLDPPSCRADFEKLLHTPNTSPLYVTYKALPWHSQNKKPKKICWDFGDGKDTCIEYSPNYTGNYLVRHRYAEPGLYNVCITIIYFGNCEAEKCKPVQVGNRDKCKADFSVLPVTVANHPLTTVFKALPWHNNNKKPKLICWRFGDGSDTCIEYPANYDGAYTVRHTYREPGKYEVCVKILYYGGCEARFCKPVQIGRPDECKADFERIPLTNTDHPLVVGFKALPSHNNQKTPKIICWSFGDGKDTCIEYAQNFAGPYVVRHRYAQPGTYTVCVKITYYGGCEARNCKTIVVQRPDECAADFEKLAVSSTNNPLSVVYKALPRHNNQKKPRTICWKFGDGKDTCITYPENYTGSYLVKHTYREPGRYEVCVKILYYGGCEAYKCKVVVLERPDECKADFERILLTNTDYPLVVGFKALPSHNNQKTPKVICWSFGDGKDTCIEYAQNFAGPYVVRHRYAQPGTYTVCVKITYYGGCEARKCKTILVQRPDECSADFEKLAVSSTNNPLSVVYKALPRHSNQKKPKTICWKFGDGKDTCITYPENYTGSYLVRHTYREPGRYEVCVKILYYGGCEARKCKEVIIGIPDECKADFERLPVSVANNPLSVIYQAKPWHNNNKKPVKICWKFGDGSDTCIEYPANYDGNYSVRHTYREPGNYEVCVKITYYGGCEAFTCKQIRIGHPSECKADFERMPVSTNDPLQVAFKALPWQINNMKPKEICWKFGDGSDTCIKYGEDYNGVYGVRHKYQRPGNYEVCIKIIYYGGCEAKKCEVVKVEGPGECKVKLYEVGTSATSLVRGFYAIPWSSNNKRPVRVCWYFGDGTDTCVAITSVTQLAGLFIRHEYPGAGVYRTCVKILFDGGCIATDCEEVIIRPSTNVCGGFMTDSLVGPKTYKFKAFAIHNPDDPVIGYRWTFGDGSSATGREVTHRYNAPGTYEVCLYIKTRNGCESKICKKLVVHGLNTPIISLTPNPAVSVIRAQFTSTVTETVNIRIVNQTGNVVRTYQRNATENNNTWELDVSTLVAGSYMLQIQSPNQTVSQLFIKQ